LIQPDPGLGRLAQDIAGSGEKLVEKKRIDLHRRVTVGQDGVEIDVWVIKARGEAAAKGTALLLHKFNDSKLSFLGTGERLAAKGYDVVLPDLRAHGRSSGTYCTHGVREKTDVKHVVDALLSEGVVHEPIYACGEGLGAVTAIHYAAAEPRCKGVMSYGAYADFAALAGWMTRYLRSEERQDTLQHAAEAAEFDINEASALKVIAALKCPVLLVHARLDMAVPVQHAEQLYRVANEPKELLLIDPLLLMYRWEDWLAEQVDRLATTGLKKPGP
jgi:pimeloyl-ACP methyl ester carboxylesterase